MTIILKCIFINYYLGVNWNVAFNCFAAYSLGLRPLAIAYLYVIGVSPRPLYIFSLDKTACRMGKRWYRDLILKYNWRWEHNLKAIYTMCQATNF